MGAHPTELPMPVEETYRDILRLAVEEAGSQRHVARLAGINQATVQRALQRGYPTSYTTLARLASVLPGVPAPVVAVRDHEHERWCRIGAHLAAHDPLMFD